LNTTNHTSLIPEDAFEQGIREGTLGAEEELWLADPGTFKLADGAQKILAHEPASLFSGELIDCEIESNTGVHDQPAGVLADLVSRRRILLGHAEQLGRVLGTSGTHPIGDWREQQIIDKPHYQRLQKKLGWLIRRNNTFSLHVHYAVQGRGKAVYIFNRLREYVPHMLGLSVNSPFWQGEYTDMHSARVLMFSRAYHRAGLPEPFGSWTEYTDYVDYLTRAGLIDALGEIWWDVRLHPGLGTVEIRAFDAQTDVARYEALVALAAALCDMLTLEYDSGGPMPIIPNREIEENKWSAQRYGLEGIFIDHETHQAVDTRAAIATLVARLSEATYRDLSGVERALGGPTESVRQLEVWRETGSTLEVAKDLARRTSAL
jgi:glutamate---cysteine ligase / carboxylate-amine ligase